MLLHYPLVAFVELYKSIIEEVSITPPEDMQLLALVAERISNQVATPSRSSYMAKLKTATALCSSVCMSIKGAREFSEATSPTLPLSTFPLPDQSLSGRDHWFPSSDSLFMSPNPGPRLSMPSDNLFWDTSYQIFSENKHPMQETVSLSGKSDYISDYPLQYLANAPPVTNHSSSDNHENACRPSPLYPFQQRYSASQATHDPPQAVSPKDWPPTMMSDQMDFSSYLDNLGAT